MKYHCFFEQSGTFKNEFKKLGYEAFDYDIQNEFNETDYVVDLFKEIENAYDKKKSIFDLFTEEDMIIAFFPCVRFEAQVLLWFRGENSAQKNWSIKKKLETDLKYHEELNQLYSLITKMALVCIDKKIKLVIENPYSTQHYLQRYWCIKPLLIDEDRSKMGDYYKKPTQYYFINCEPKYNFIMQPLEYVEQHSIVYNKGINNNSVKTSRSMIHPQYANRFIREFIIDEKVVDNEL